MSDSPTTSIDPRTLGYASAGGDLAMGAALPGVVAREHRDGDRYTLRLWAPDAWATATYEPGRASYDVQQAGDRALWDDALNAYFAWITNGSAAQSFTFTNLPGTTHYMIKPLAAQNMCADAGNLNSGDVPVLRPCTNSTAQQYEYQPDV
ncbi:RICIN domain-containing protein [Actinomadura pelletieri]|uniref:RICIN domain-containing protein n=1 Tax=Actinomadura pelletieri TaxID=111805 RepID=UPI000EABBCC0|nr:RICIN domain-containing protein [Actinomadura pelletieri]